MMENDPYVDVIDEQWNNIVLMYRTFKDKEQIIEYDVEEKKIYSYPTAEYIGTLSERTRDHAKRQFAEASRRNQFLLFIKDTKKQRLRSYVFDLPE